MKNIDRERALDRMREMAAEWKARGFFPTFTPHHLREPLTKPSLGTEPQIKVFFGALLADGLLKPERGGRYKLWRLVEIERGTWRCSSCGDASQLYGCAEAIIHGRVDGPESVTLDGEEQIGLCAGSIECQVHQSTEPLERFDGYRWVRWVPCEKCGGSGRVPNRWDVRQPEIGCSFCQARGGSWPGLGPMNPFGAH